MSQGKKFSNPAFQSPSKTLPAMEFNLAPVVNNFNSVFNTQPLEEKESLGLETLLVDHFLPGKVSEDQIGKDLGQLKTITAEIKAISNQGIVLTGERIQKAREILKPYKDGAFTKWLESTFGSRRTAYNVLSYYELYSDLPNNMLKERFKKFPQKAAYLLASKDADIEEKAKIIEDYHESSTNELVMLIQDRFPPDCNDGRRKDANRTLLDSIEQSLKKLSRRKNHLSTENLKQIAYLRTLIDELLNDERSNNRTILDCALPECAAAAH